MIRYETMSRQSTRNLILIEPATFGYNAETASTNAFQLDAHENADAVFAAAVKQFRAFRDLLVEAGASVTVIKGAPSCPDAVFPSWFTTHDDGTVYLYPMMAPSRRRERSDDLIAFFHKFYAVKRDLLANESEGVALEGAGSMVLDRVNCVAYIARSKRTDEKLARDWCARMGYEPVVFDTVGHNGKPVYHTSMVMWVGSEVAGIGANMIVEADRARVLQSLARTHEVLELDNAQIRAYCGNAVEFRGADDQPMLAMSEAAYGILTSDQLSRLNRYYTRIVSSSLSTIEAYGGASARNIVQELF